MKITTLMEYHELRNPQILRESCDGLTRDQRKIVEGIYRELTPLIEASLTADQINQLFGQVEKSATAAGGNRTLLGKGVDTVAKANEIIDNVGKWLQNTTPVKNFDAKFDKLKNDINKKFPDSKILDGISKMGIWAQENPGKTAAIVGILTAIASLAAGPVGGAIAGQVLKGSVELLKGEKLSTAIGKGLKAAAVGWLAGKSFELIGDALGKGAEMVADKLYPGARKLNLKFIADGIGYPSTYQELGVIGKPEDVAKLKDMFRAATDAWRDENYGPAMEAFRKAADMAASMNSDEYLNAMAIASANRDEILGMGTEAVKMMQGLAVAAQGAATGATGMDKSGKPAQAQAKESRYIQHRPLSEGQVYLVFDKIQRLDEGPMDAIKGFAGKAAQKVSQMGTNLTTKITADKLSSAWRKAGSPMDSDALAQFLEKQGVSADIVKQTYADMKLPAPGTGAEVEKAKAGYDSVLAMVNKLPVDRKARLLKWLTSGKGSADAAQPAA